MTQLTHTQSNGSHRRDGDSVLFRPSNGNGKVVSSTEPSVVGRTTSSPAQPAADATAGSPPASLNLRPVETTANSPRASDGLLAQLGVNMTQWLAWQQQQQEVSRSFLVLQQQYMELIAGGAGCGGPRLNASPVAPTCVAPNWALAAATQAPTPAASASIPPFAAAPAPAAALPPSLFRVAAPAAAARELDRKPPPTEKPP